MVMVTSVAVSFEMKAGSSWRNSAMKVTGNHARICGITMVIQQTHIHTDTRTFNIFGKYLVKMLEQP